MKTHTEEELKEIIRKHHKWLFDLNEGKKALGFWKKWKPILESIGVFDGVTE